MRRRSRDPKTLAIVRQRLDALEEMEHCALQAEWRKRFRHEPPPRLSRRLLQLGVAWKIQAKALGGLTAATKRELERLARSLEEAGDIRRERVVRLKPGAKLIREWRGETHTVLVLEEGFEWRGRQWRSLTAIAREISGAKWSGPRFFGLTRPDRRGDRS
jgi:hypothetical protein